jgi:hypothetical protein
MVTSAAPCGIPETPAIIGMRVRSVRNGEDRDRCRGQRDRSFGGRLWFELWQLVVGSERKLDSIEMDATLLGVASQR